MFDQTAELYDTIYSFKNYKQETEQIKTIIHSSAPASKSILDVGCGTSEHHKYLKAEYDIDGIDLNRTFIKISHEKNPNGNYVQADMRKFELNKTYDLVMCLFSSIGYLRSVDEIVSALVCFKNHLNPGGLILVEPWFTKESWTNGKTHMITTEKDGVKICRMNRSASEGDFSIVHFHYLVGSDDQDVKHLEERHELRMTSNVEMISAFERAGLKVHFEEKGLIGRGMYHAKN